MFILYNCLSICVVTLFLIGCTFMVDEEINFLIKQVDEVSALSKVYNDPKIDLLHSEIKEQLEFVRIRSIHNWVRFHKN